MERSLFGLVWTESKEVSQHCRQVMGGIGAPLSQAIIDGVCTCICGRKARRLIASGNEEDWARLLVEDMRENLLEEELVFHQKWHGHFQRCGEEVNHLSIETIGSEDWSNINSGPLCKEEERERSTRHEDKRKEDDTGYQPENRNGLGK